MYDDGTEETTTYSYKYDNENLIITINKPDNLKQILKFNSMSLLFEDTLYKNNSVLQIEINTYDSLGNLLSSIQKGKYSSYSDTYDTEYLQKNIYTYDEFSSLISEEHIFNDPNKNYKYVLTYEYEFY